MKSAVRMFLQNDQYLAICFHGNDHSAAEFASSNLAWLNTVIRVAEERMDIHTKATGLACGKVMVFPQEMFSLEAMKVLKSRNFVAAVNGGPSPAGRHAVLTIRELAQPAVLRHGGFPLFLRKYVAQVKREDVAFDLFFGRPILIVEHHDVFRNPERLLEAVLMINSMAADISWCNLATAIMGSTLRRNTSSGVCEVRAYSGTITLANNSDSPRSFAVEWNHSAGSPSVEHILLGGTPNQSFEVSDCAIRLSVELAPRSSQTLSLVYRNDHPSLNHLGFPWAAKAFIRRRLSEARDNYVSKNRLAMAAAHAVRRRILSKIL